MDDQTDNPREEVLGSLSALKEQSLAVSLARADLDQAIVTAHNFPRNPEVIVKKITQLALQNEASAERCVYALPRGGKPIVGASIGLMKIVGGCYGNCHIKGEPSHIDRTAKLVFATGYFKDLESNVTNAVTVSRRISDKNGRIYNDDMIAVTMMAAVSIAKRNVIRDSVSEGLWFPIYERALYMVRGTEATLPERRAKAVAALAQYGVDPKRVFLFLNVAKIEDIGIEHMPTLRGLYTTLREGTVSAEELLDPRRMSGMAFDATAANPLGDEEDEKKEQDTATKEAPAAAQAKAQDAPQQEAPQAQGEQPNAPAATAAEKKQAAAPKEQKPPDPKNPADYVTHAMTWLREAKEVGDIEKRWTKERGLRNAIGMTADERAPLEAEKKRRLEELSK